MADGVADGVLVQELSKLQGKVAALEAASGADKQATQAVADNANNYKLECERLQKEQSHFEERVMQVSTSLSASSLYLSTMWSSALCPTCAPPVSVSSPPRPVPQLAAWLSAHCLALRSLPGSPLAAWLSAHCLALCSLFWLCVLFSVLCSSVTSALFASVQ